MSTLRRVAFLLAWITLYGAVPSASASPPGLPLGDLLSRLEAAYREKSVDAYLALWTPPSAESRIEEAEFVRQRFAAAQSGFLVRRPVSVAQDARSLDVGVQVFTVDEPHAMVEEWALRLERNPQGWSIAERETRSRIDGLIHLSFAPQGFKADGLTLSLQDFTLRLDRGTLFFPPVSVGYSAIVFVGEAQVRFGPGPPTEQDQLRQFCGNPELVEKVRTAFLRLHPVDLGRMLGGADLVPDPDSASRFPEAEKVFRAQGSRSYVLDTSLPGAPWWLTPGPGSAVVSFETAHHGTLTLTVSADDFEGVSLFDRARRLQICLYPLPGHPTRYNEDEGRIADVVNHDLRVRFEPSARSLVAEDTLRIRLLQPSASLRLRLNADLRVHSVVSPNQGDLLFFRVRHQDSLMVALGPLSGTIGEVQLTVRYSGVLTPRAIERDVVQVLETNIEEIPIEEVLTYSNRDFWYPEVNADDHAVAQLRFDVPEGFLAVSGGTALPLQTEGDRTVAEYRQEQPARYFSVCVGRLAEVTRRQEEGILVQGFGTPRTRSEASSFVNQALEILRFYRDWFGAYPFSTLNFVLIEGRTPGGHSPPGMIVLAQRPAFLRSSLRDDPGSVNPDPAFFLAHELAHQWWGQAIAPQNYHERWLSEGAAQYAAALWVRHKQGEDAFRDALRRMSRWAVGRSNEGPISLGYRLGHLKHDPQAFRAIVYDKAAMVLHMLRGIVGDEAFRQAVIRFQSERRFAKAGTEDFREALETASGKTLEPFFREWFYGTAIPTLRVSHRREQRAGGSYRTLVDIQPQGLPGPVPVEIVVAHGGGRQTQRATLDPTGGTFSIDTTGRPRKVTVNGDVGLLARVESR